MSAHTDTFYTDVFFEGMQDGASRSARGILPFVIRLLQPESVVDIGCGRGAWLAASSELGITDVLGLDGDYVSNHDLLIPGDRFLATDLSKPFTIPRHFSLALCLEVAEHLPRRAARPLVQTLTAAAPAVLFSAAIPGQPGTHHVNEQFPEYWSSLFADYGYVALDPFRPLIRDDIRVEPWYAQNLLLYVSRSLYESRLNRYPVVSRPEELLPWVYAGIWKGRVTWRGPLSLFSILLRRLLP